MLSIETMLSARLFVHPQTDGDRLFFLSNMGQGGHLSLYAMDLGGSVPEPLLPPQIAVQNPHLVEGETFVLFPALHQILVMLDHDGDEKYQPMLIPYEGGVPELAFGDTFATMNMTCLDVDVANNIAYFLGESRTEEVFIAFQVNLATRAVRNLGQSQFGNFVIGANANHTHVITVDSYSGGDHVLYEWRENLPERRLLFGIPLDQRAPGQTVTPNTITTGYFLGGDTGLLVNTSLFSDTYGLGYLDLNDPREVQPVAITGTQHTGAGELTHLKRLHGDRFLLEYNIDGCSWLYEGSYDAADRTMRLDIVLCGNQAPLVNGMLEAIAYDAAADRFALAFSTATSPAQLYTISGVRRDAVARHTRERILGLTESQLAPGEDASFTSYDGERISARLYLPAPELGFDGPRPLVYYVHGGPQGQERPDYTWFSMPLIQFLTLNGFAVFVPNVRGSTGYGLRYTKLVEHDWGGNDRLDHVHAMTKVLPNDPRIDIKHAGVVGRSYGGYMTLTLAGRHPELWSAAVDMFGPYDLFTFIDRLPATWRGAFYRTVGNPETEPDFLRERSPKTYIDQITCPLLVIQGQNDPRVIEQESRDVVEHLRTRGHATDYLLFPDEGHDVLKFANRVRCYNAITDFFRQHLGVIERELTR